MLFLCPESCSLQSLSDVENPGMMHDKDGRQAGEAKQGRLLSSGIYMHIYILISFVFMACVSSFVPFVGWLVGWFRPDLSFTLSSLDDACRSSSADVKRRSSMACTSPSCFP